MVKYKIVHSTGEFSVDVTGHGENCFATILDGYAPIELIVRGKNEDDLYWNCRSWASNNIRGEFHFESVSADHINVDTPVSTAA